MTRPTREELIERIDSEIACGDSLPDVPPIELLKDLRSHLSNPWIPVEERLPDDYEIVSFHDGDTVFSGYRRRLHGSWYRPETESYIGNVTHWCPLPPLPTKGGEA